MIDHIIEDIKEEMTKIKAKRLSEAHSKKHFHTENLLGQSVGLQKALDIIKKLQEEAVVG